MINYCKKIIPLLYLIAVNSCSYIKESGYYKGKKSDHFDGKKFYNPKSDHIEDSTFLGYLSSKRKYRAEQDSEQHWPSGLKKIKQTIPEAKINSGMKATFIGHATFLLQFDGLNVLTDPVWSKRIGPFNLLGPKRSVIPGINFKNLPKIDAVIISHSHYDHLDVRTVSKLKKYHNPKFFAGLGMCHYLNEVKDLDIDCHEMDWNESIKLSENTEIFFLRAKHWSKRAFFGSHATLWGSFAIKSKSGNIYFAGDTAYDDHFDEIGDKFGKFDLSLLPIGAYEPDSFMSPHHMDPEDAVRAHLDLKSKKSIAMHYKTFNLSSEDYDEPEDDLKKAKNRHGVKNDFVCIDIGESVSVGNRG